MIFTYGSYRHTDNSVAITGLNQSYAMGQMGRPHMRRVQWNLEGKLLGVSQTDIMDQLSTLIAAYTFHGQSAGFYGTPFWLDSGSAVGGVLVTNPISFGAIKGAEGVTYLKYQFGLQADFPFARAGTVLDFKESISFTNNDGLPIRVERLPQNGLPILQQVSTNSWYMATQQGSITTAFSSAGPLPPLFPDSLRTSGGAAVNVVYQSPVMQRGTLVSYTTTWKYDFISSQPLYSPPHAIG